MPTKAVTVALSWAMLAVLLNRQGMEVVDVELVLVVVGSALLGVLVEVAVVDTVEENKASVVEEEAPPLEGVCDSDRTDAAPTAETPITATTTRARTLEMPGRLANRRLRAKASRKGGERIYRL